MEKAKGNNLPEEIDWLTVEKEIDERCNADYQVVRKKLVIVAKHDLHKAKHPEEIDEGSRFYKV